MKQFLLKKTLFFLSLISKGELQQLSSEENKSNEILMNKKAEIFCFTKLSAFFVFL